MKDKSKGLSIGGNMLWNTVGSVIGLAAQWLVSILIVRLSTNFDDAGAYSLAFSIYAIFVPVAVFRSDLYQLSDVERKYSPGEYLSFRLITCAGTFAAIVLYSLATGAAWCLPVVCAFTFWKTSSLVISCLHTTDQVNHRMDYVGQSVALQGLASLAMFACVFSATRNLVLTLFLMAVATLAIGLFLDLPRTRSLVDLKFELSRKMVVDLGKSCLPIVASGLIVAAVPSLPRQFLCLRNGRGCIGCVFFHRVPCRNCPVGHLLRVRTAYRVLLRGVPGCRTPLSQEAVLNVCGRCPCYRRRKRSGSGHRRACPSFASCTASLSVSICIW